MVTPSTPKIQPIKLKLSLGSKLSNPAPLPSTSIPTPTPTPTIKLTTGKKGKGKDKLIQQDDLPPSTPSNTEQEEGGKKKKKIKSKVSNAEDTPVNEQNNNQEISLNDENDNKAGPSKIIIPNPSSLLHQQPDEEQIEQETEHPAISVAAVPMTPTPANKSKPSRPTTSKRNTTGTKSTPRTSKSSSSAKSRSTGIGRSSKPSAIPSRLLSETATSVSTPTKSFIPLSETTTTFETPTATTTAANSITHDSSEATSPDPLSLPLSPSAYNGDSIGVGTPQNDVTGYEDTPQSGRGRTGGRWMRIKRPLKELLNKILVEMRRKDDYALFEEPVDLEAFPDYLDIIGGEDKMMDMGTMQSKVDNGEYTSVEQLEVDLRMLVEAAQKFNPPGTVPYNSAGRVLTIGLKHVERSKPLVLTPSPSPTRESATPFGRGFSVFSGREGTVGLDESLRRVEDLPPTSYIPEQMLNFPPNSLQALAVGWNLNGGKRIHAKRVVRSREKFGGKWRNWEIDGARDLAEMDDVVSLLDQWRIPSKDELSKFIDWRRLRKSANQGQGQGQWWESDTSLSGPTTMAGQPPTPFTAYNPRRDKIIERELDPKEFGLDSEIVAEIKYLRKTLGPISNKDSDDEILSEHLRPLKPKPNSLRPQLPPPPPNQPSTWVDIYENPYPLNRNANDWIREMVTGDTRGEAYLSSISKFVDGAMKSAKEVSSTSNRQNVLSDEDIKVKNDEDSIPLDEYVFEKYHDGLISKRSKSRKIVSGIYKGLSKPSIDKRSSYIKDLMYNSYSKIALNELTSPLNPMDIKPLLRLENDFLHQGVGGKKSGLNGIKDGLIWTGKEIENLDKKLRAKLDDVKNNQSEYENRSVNSLMDNIVEGSKRKREEEEEDDNNDDDNDNIKKIKLESSSNPSNKQDPIKSHHDNNIAQSKDVITINPHSDPPDSGDTKELRQLRLELVALSKFYPLPALKKMRYFEAAKLLPPNVRNLMTIPEDLQMLNAQKEKERLLKENINNKRDKDVSSSNSYQHNSNNNKGKLGTAK